MAGFITDADYKCTLDEKTFEKAKQELGEDPAVRIVLVKTLRQRLEGVPGLKARTDVKFLLPFLRSKKFELERAFELVKNYYEVRKNGDIFDDLKPSRVKHVIDAGLIEVLKERDNNGCRVVIMRMGKWDPDAFPMIELPKAMFLILSKLMENEETQVHGVHFINNLADVTWKQAKHLSPSFAKLFLNLIQNVLPLRMKRLDYVHEPTFFDIVFSIVRQFMSEKLVGRIYLNGNTYEKLHATIDPNFLPTDLGGKRELYHNKEFMTEFLRSDAMFEEDNKYGYLNMKLEKKKEKRQEDAGMQGLGGTFKKLDN